MGRSNKQTRQAPVGARRQWAADRALRPSMRSPGRPEPSRAVQRDFWRPIASGATTADAAEAVGVSWPVGSRWFRHAGGMPPISLDEPTGRYLSFTEREEIALLRAQDVGVREIARRIGRDPGTISRELRRNAATRSGTQVYRAGVAQWKAQQAAKRPKTAKLVDNDRLREYVQERLSGAVRRPDGTAVAGPDTPAWKGLNKPHRQDRRWATAWSPQQISHRLKVDFPEDESMRISHEAIYQSLYIEGRGALKRELVTCLRTGRALRVPRSRSQNKPQGHVTADVDLNAGAQGWASWWMRGDSSAWWRAWRSLVGLKESGDEVCCGAPVSVTKKMTQVDLYEDRFCGEIGCVADSTVGFDEERAVGFVDEGGGDVHGGVQWDRASILHGEGSGDCGCLGDPQGETHDVIACR